MEEWSALANKRGYLDWDGFSTGLARALRANAPRLTGTPQPPQQAEGVGAGRTSHRGRGSGVSLLRHPVEPGEIERFLGGCDGGVLVEALARCKKEEYRCQMSLQQMTSTVAANQKKASSESMCKDCLMTLYNGLRQDALLSHGLAPDPDVCSESPFILYCILAGGGGISPSSLCMRNPGDRLGLNA